MFPNIGCNKNHSNRARDRDAVMSVFNEVVLSQFMYHNGRPFVTLETDGCFDPALKQVLAKRAELMVEIAVSIQRANDLVNAHVLHTRQFSAGPCTLYLFMEFH